MNSQRKRLVLFANQNTGREIVQFLSRQPDAQLAAVVCYSGRQGPSWHGSVAEAAQDCGAPVLLYSKTDIAERLRALGAFDLLLSICWRERIAADVLALPRRGAVNFHNSLLPRHRGVFANTWPLLLGETTGGVSLHWMTPQFDDGEVIAQRCFPIPGWYTARETAERVHDAYLQLFEAAWKDVDRWREMSREQDPEAASYHTLRDFQATNEMDLNRRDTLGAFINYLRAKTYEPYYKNAFFIDPRSGKKIFVSVILTPEDGAAPERS